MSESDKQVFLNLLHTYLKVYKKFPSLEKFSKESPIHSMFVSNVDNKILYKVLEEDFINRLKEGNTKTIKVLREAYEGNKELFIKFFRANYIGVIDNKFQKLGLEVLPILQDSENKVIWNMETTQYKTFSTSLTNKYWEIVSQYFPLYNQIGVTTRKNK